MFRVKHLPLDTLREHVIVIHERAVRTGKLGFNPLDRAYVLGTHPVTGAAREITGVLNFCSDTLLAPDEIGLSEEAFRDLGLPEGTAVNATLAVAPRSVDLVRSKLLGRKLDRAAFDAILADVVRRRYSRVELAMFVLSCALRGLDTSELAEYTRAMIGTGARLDFGPGPVADKHSVGGIPGNRTTMIVVPILAALGVKMPKTSSRAITSPSGTADTMGAVAEVALGATRIHEVVGRAGACIAWGGALELAPADDILITVERPMEIDTEAQMVASILAKKKTVGATDVLIDIPVGASAKVRSLGAAEHLANLFRAVAREIELRLDVVVTEAHGPVGRGIGPRLEALDVLAVLRREPDAPADLREKSLYLAARLLEMTGVVEPAAGYRAAQKALDSGAALAAFDRIVDAQGRREFPAPAAFKRTVEAVRDGRIREIDCWEIARVAKRAGAPANIAAGVRIMKTVGEIVARGEPVFEIHAESEAQLDFARAYAEAHAQIVKFGF
ncbi:MAG TPA: thymidine phosphorylase family protein [Candidatus Binataceae bacterium]|nr:thymidine phosphorylase family protein [Candidatus Binataceae bacterium]